MELDCQGQAGVDGWMVDRWMVDGWMVDGGEWRVDEGGSGHTEERPVGSCWPLSLEDPDSRALQSAGVQRRSSAPLSAVPPLAPKRVRNTSRRPKVSEIFQPPLVLPLLSPAKQSEEPPIRAYGECRTLAVLALNRSLQVDHLLCW